jgi:hypothetical protein
MDRRISRRDFLKLMGAGALIFGFGALGGFAGLFRKQQSYVASAQPILQIPYLNPIDQSIQAILVSNTIIGANVTISVNGES